MADNVATPATLSSAYVAMQAYWQMIDDILGGAPTMRAAGSLYLPMFQNEMRLSKDMQGEWYDRYDARRVKAPFTNIYEDISTTLASKPFSKEFKLIEGTPKQYLDLSEDIDGQGNNLHTFGHEVFQKALDYAISWILVDFTRATPVPSGRPLTISEERTQGLRPYWVHIPPKKMLAIYSDFINGEEIIYHARIDESIVRTDGYQEVEVGRIRIMERAAIRRDDGVVIGYGPAFWSLWERVVGDREANNTADTSQQWKFVDAGPLSVGVIPLVKVILGRREGTSFVVQPPLKNIAYKQIEEYQQESALQNIMELTCFPMLAGNGMSKPEGGVVPVGPQAVLFAPPTAGGQIPQWTVLEPAGTSIDKVIDRLEKTQNMMRDLGRQPLTMQNLTVITTGQVAAKANSAAQAWALQMKDAAEQAWKLTAEWLGDQTFEPEVVIHLDYTVGMDEGKGFNAVLELRKNKDVSRETALTSAVRYGYLPDDFNMDKDEEQLAQEAEDLQPEMPIDPRTGLPIAQVPQPKPKPGPPPTVN